MTKDEANLLQFHELNSMSDELDKCYEKLCDMMNCLESGAVVDD